MKNTTIEFIKKLENSFFTFIIKKKVELNEFHYTMYNEDKILIIHDYDNNNITVMYNDKKIYNHKENFIELKEDIFNNDIYKGISLFIIKNIK